MADSEFYVTDEGMKAIEQGQAAVVMTAHWSRTDGKIVVALATMPDQLGNFIATLKSCGCQMCRIMLHELAIDDA